jgi:hypothetical protein
VPLGLPPRRRRCKNRGEENDRTGLRDSVATENESTQHSVLSHSALGVVRDSAAAANESTQHFRTQHSPKVGMMSKGCSAERGKPLLKRDTRPRAELEKQNRSQT